MREITEEMLSTLREKMLTKMSPKRFRHTVAVEEMVARLCSLYCPEQTNLMRAAALLHDLTKELPLEDQVALSRELGLPVLESDLLSPKTFHARTAAAKIARDFSEFSDPVIVESVRWHTTGHAGMTLTEKLVYLADYIDLSRTFENCVILRRFFWGADPERMDAAARDALLCDTLLMSYDMTVRDLLDDGTPIALDTMEARNELIFEKSQRKQ